MVSQEPGDAQDLRRMVMVFLGAGQILGGKYSGTIDSFISQAEAGQIKQVYEILPAQSHVGGGLVGTLADQPKDVDWSDITIVVTYQDELTNAKVFNLGGDGFVAMVDGNNGPGGKVVIYETGHITAYFMTHNVQRGMGSWSLQRKTLVSRIRK